MRLRKPCEHDRYEEHDNRDSDGWLRAPHPCPGGEFLPEDAELIERIAKVIEDRVYTEQARVIAAGVFDALAADQVGEPG